MLLRYARTRITFVCGPPPPSLPGKAVKPRKEVKIDPTFLTSVPVRDGDFAPAPTLPQNLCPADTTAAIRNPDRSSSGSPYISDVRTKCSVAGDAVDFLLPPKPTTSSRGPSTSPANSSSRDLETYPWLSTHEGDYFLPSGECTQSTSRAIFNNTVLRKSYLRHRISDDSAPMPSYCDPIGLERRHPSYNNSNDSDGEEDDRERDRRRGREEDRIAWSAREIGDVRDDGDVRRGLFLPSPPFSFRESRS
ncbi:unnamed protein product [Dibothriocephalus latus]|uniref:Uncharacterized protein n=1 Tax=Dibothriocephalus latus TaxID=60516 RepID=A0A3P7LXU6_DIBLA|nr:unnamed protein product [Dibothriocephalus latus]